MTERSGGPDDHLPVFGRYKAHNLFRADWGFGRVRISGEHPITGELVYSQGTYYLVPDEDSRSGDMTALRLRDPLSLLPDCPHVGRQVDITGIYDDREGITVESLIRHAPLTSDE
jgi:hypothetical protein